MSAVDVTGCARCGEDHPGLLFAPIDRPIEFIVTVNGGFSPATFAHWAPCPTNGQPVLLAIAGTG